MRPSVDIWDDVPLNSQTIAAPRTTTGRVWLVLGWAAVLLPVVYMTVVGWDSGEHGGTVILLGLSATLFQLAVWGSAWATTRHLEAVTRDVAFGAGATISLVVSLLVLAITVKVLDGPLWLAGSQEKVEAGGSWGDV